MFTFTDSDGDMYTGKLTGPGTATVTQLDPDGDERGPIDSIVLAGTSAASKLKIMVDDGGEVSIGSITGGQIGQIIAPQSDLTGAGVTLAGAVKTLVFDDLLAGTAIVADGKIGAL